MEFWLYRRTGFHCPAGVYVTINSHKQERKKSLCLAESVPVNLRKRSTGTNKQKITLSPQIRSRNAAPTKIIPKQKNSPLNATH
jgi:hypothetical protein